MTILVLEALVDCLHRRRHARRAASGRRYARRRVADDADYMVKDRPLDGSGVVALERFDDFPVPAGRFLQRADGGGLRHLETVTVERTAFEDRHQRRKIGGAEQRLV